MSFSSLVYQKKLEALQDTQESIVSISQWLLFHHRHCKELCELWAQYITSEDPSLNLKKKLALFYLCNDVVQQARHKRKPEFAEEFSKLLPNILHKIYPTMNPSLQPKLERLVGVWEQRAIFTKVDIQNMRLAIELLKNGQEFLALGDDLQSSKTNQALALAPIATDLVHLNDLYNHLQSVLSTASSNLSQVGVQCKQYLPQNPENLDNLPLPNVYITKLNVLEKLCNMTTKNLEEALSVRKNIISVLGNLSNLLNDGLAADDTKLNIIAQRLERLKSTKSELHEMLGTSPEREAPETEMDEEEEPSPVFETSAQEDDMSIPTYVDSSDSDDNSERSHASINRGLKRRRLSGEADISASALSTTPKSTKKTVAFSEDIQVKEFTRDEQSNSIQILRSENESDDEELTETNGYDFNDSERQEFERHHKDDLELRHERQLESEDDSYDPSSLGGSGTNGHSMESGDVNGENNSQPNSGLLSLLSKLS